MALSLVGGLLDRFGIWCDEEKKLYLFFICERSSLGMNYFCEDETLTPSIHLLKQLIPMPCVWSWV